MLNSGLLGLVLVPPVVLGKSDIFILAAIDLLGHCRLVIITNDCKRYMDRDIGQLNLKFRHGFARKAEGTRGSRLHRRKYRLPRISGLLVIKEMTR